ncbi:hypothetical protein M5K25_010200 [Dendrobium thyrsiflorum]|uniref:Uncharacterized protein n=1 Tax=Dendrobium thyrsiflorum TaxID=117978 RepID=A0ABD0V6M8_DENTH
MFTGAKFGISFCRQKLTGHRELAAGVLVCSSTFAVVLPLHEKWSTDNKSFFFFYGFLLSARVLSWYQSDPWRSKPPPTPDSSSPPLPPLSQNTPFRRISNF